jgi:hypothetical protein
MQFLVEVDSDRFADLVEEEKELNLLRSELASLKEKHRWISVEERLPQSECHDVYRCETPHVWHEEYFCRCLVDDGPMFDRVTFDMNTGEWFSLSDDGERIKANVTHWTLLPDPIEEG